MAEITKELIESIVEEVSEGKSDSDKAKAKELMIKMFENGVSAKDAMGLSDDFLEKLYSDAYNHYQAGQYEKAYGIFNLLMLFNPSDPRFPMGSACCFHKSEKYLEAIALYKLSSSIDPENFLPLYYASDCFIKIGDKSGALILLKAIHEKIKVDPKHSVLKERLERSIDALNKDIKKD